MVSKYFPCLNHY